MPSTLALLAQKTRQRELLTHTLSCVAQHSLPLTLPSLFVHVCMCVWGLSLSWSLMLSLSLSLSLSLCLYVSALPLGASDSFGSNFWMTVLSGRKLWQFFDEDQLPFLYPSHQDDSFGE